MRANSCWACRDSRASCDYMHPRCSKCAMYDKACQYGLRLSWPKTNNPKRSMTYTIENRFRITKRFSQTGFVNATSWDIQLRNYLLTNQVIGLRSHEDFVYRQPDPPLPLSWLPIQLGHKEKELLNHFQYTAFSALANFDSNHEELLSLLMRLALSDTSPSSVAVLQSVLALSSLHRYGMQPDAFRLKARSIRTLITSGKHCVESPRAAQHIAAGMILCYFQMLDMLDTSTQWFCYLSEAKHLIGSTDFRSHKFHGEFSILLDWVEYHTIMGEFSLRHWRTIVQPIAYKHPINAVSNYVPPEQAVCQRRKIKGVSYCSHEILQLLYLMFKTILKPTHSLYHSNEYESSLRCLESRIYNIDLSARDGIADTMSGLSKIQVATQELYKLAALIYLKRASRNFSGASLQIDIMVKRAL